MAWKTMDIQEQRVRFVVAASREEKSLTAKDGAPTVLVMPAKV
jgi:hypothetical protein